MDDRLSDFLMRRVDWGDNSASKRPLAARPIRADSFVLYWMHSALRAHENPALDVAICWAKQNGLPLLVYHALSEGYPFASDRFHAFVLQGHRDVQRELRDRGIRAFFHLERSGHRGPHLRHLAKRASVLVTENMPVAPVTGWIERLASSCDTPIAKVDTSCLLPFPDFKQKVDHFSAYRSETKTFYQQHAGKPYIEQTFDGEIFSGDLPFEPVCLQSESLADLISECQIDHSIGPVIDMPGGTRAGYRRWKAFKENLRSAPEDRPAEPLHPSGDSRIGAYLHFGMVSPFRIARESRALGAESFADRLLTLREFSFHFCHRHQELTGSFATLPAWARETLMDHAPDPRDEDSTWETLSRSRSPDSFWNRCQQNLMQNGALHHRLRRIWGQAVLRWVSHPESAMQMVIDLNHRYALDGRDPCGLTGVLSCFGLGDQPAQTEQPCYGKVPRVSDRDEFARTFAAGHYSLSAAPTRVAVVGAGIAGLIAARSLMDQGMDVTVFDKSRGVGGRVATRRVSPDEPNGGEQLEFDHGAQYFTARDPRFRRFVQSWVGQGVAEPLTVRIVELGVGGEIQAEKSGQPRYVGAPSMNAIAKHLACDLKVRLETPIVRLAKNDGKWQLLDARGASHEGFDWVVCSCPPAQTAEIIGAHSEIAAEAAKVQMKPTWALMFTADGLGHLPYDGAFINAGPLSWIARNSAKPGRPKTKGGESWIAHASTSWTVDHLDCTRAEVQELLLEGVAGTVGTSVGTVAHATAHRWLYAIPETALPSDHLWDPVAQIAACGDWCGGPRIEGAFLSGMAAAGAILRHLSIDRPAPTMTNQP